MTNKLSVCTWNIFNGLPYGFSVLYSEKRLKKIINNIKNCNFDIFALQEVNNIEFVNLLKKNCGEKYIFYYNEKNLYFQQIILIVFLFLIYFFVRDTIAICFTFLCINFLFKNSTIYNFLMGDVSGGLLMLINKDLIHEEKSKLLFNEYKCQDGDFLNVINKRGYQKINIKFNSKEIYIYNTHLNSVNNKSTYREKQINELFQETSDKDTVILLGDFNSPKDYNEMKLDKFKLVDTNIQEELVTWDMNNHLTKTLLSEPCHQKIDYIIVKNLEFNKSGIIFNDENIASDHYGFKSEIFEKKHKKEKKK